jgi:hypothetical protein
VFGLSPQILGAILLAVGLFTSGWTVEHWRMRGKVADLKREYAEQAVKAEAEAAKRLKDAQILGDALVERVAREENKRIEVRIKIMPYFLVSLLAGAALTLLLFGCSTTATAPPLAECPKPRPACWRRCQFATDTMSGNGLRPPSDTTRLPIPD